MKKRGIIGLICGVAVAAVALVLVLIFVPKSCAGSEGGQVTQVATSFINSVNSIETPITVQSAGKINAAYTVYNLLNDTEKSLKEVSEKKAVLDGYSAEYNSIKAALDNAEEERKQELFIESFLDAVNNLPSLNALTEEDGDKIKAAADAYGKLSEASKQKQNVAEKYALLSTLEDKFAEIERAAREEEIKTLAEEFIRGVNAIGEITVESIDAIENLQYDYEDFDDDVKAYSGVAEAKQALDNAYEEYLAVKDRADVAGFLALVEKFTPAENTTLENKTDLEGAEYSYENLSDSARNAEGVAEAYAVMLAARQKYNELFAVAEEERVQIFIQAVNNIRTDIENVDITWHDALFAAEKAYNNLAFESLEREDVTAAFGRWDAAQSAFDKMGYLQIPMIDPTLLYSGDNPPHVVIQNDGKMFGELCEFYGVSSYTALDAYVTMYINVYIDGSYVNRFEMRISSISQGGHIIMNDAILSGLKSLAAKDSRIVSGANYTFSISFADKKGEYIASGETRTSPVLTARQKYTW